MNVYCNVLEPFIVQGRIPRHEMDSEVLSSILQSYALPLEEEEQAAQQALKAVNRQAQLTERSLASARNPKGLMSAARWT